MFSVDLVLQAMFLGIVFAVLTVGYNKLFIGRFVKALIKAEANHPAFAKSFSDLNIKKNFLFKLALRKGGTLMKIVAQLENDENKYYIPEDKIYRAGRLYGGKDVDLLMIAAVIVLLFLFFGVLLLYFPFFWNMVVDTFSGPLSQ
jgi:hypothetical protein